MLTDRSYLGVTDSPPVESIGNLTNMTELDLIVTDLPVCQNPWNPTNLTELKFWGSDSHPGVYWQPHEPDKLDLSRNQLTSLPESISNLTNLTELDLGLTESPACLRPLATSRT